MVEKLIIGVVGPCAAGKTTLISNLKSRGYKGVHIAQEHSFVQDMWARITNPHLLVYLDVSFEQSMRRRKLDWTEQDFREQVRRLRHAREHADIYIDTNNLVPEQVVDRVIKEIEKALKARL